MKVAFVHNTIAPYRHPLFERLSEALDLIVYYCSEKADSRKWELWPRNYDYKYRLLPRISIKTPLGEFNLNPSIMKEIIKDKPRVLIIGGYTDPTTWLAFIIAKLLKISIIYWTEGIKEPSSFLGNITKPLRKIFIKRSNAVVVPGKLSKKYVIKLGAIKEKVFVAPNTIDNELFINISNKHRRYKNQLKAQLGFKEKVIILSVGQLIERKGFKYLLQAFSKIEKEHGDVMLLLCGSGPLKTNLKELANMLKIQKFKIVESGLSLEQLIMLYSLADIFVFPTLEDIWGFVINEAMACGLPVVATRASQAAVEMISNEENGYVVKEGNIDDLYMCLKRLIQNCNLREKMGRKSLEIITRNYSADNMAYGFIEAIKCVLKQA